MIIPECLQNKQTFKLKKQRIHLIEYTSCSENILNEVIFSDSAIVFIKQGKKIITSSDFSIEVCENQLFLIPPGKYLMSEYLPNNGEFESTMLFFNYYQLIEIINSISNQIKLERKSHAPICVINSTPVLNHYFESLLHINFETNRFGLAKDFINLKMKELILHLLSDASSHDQIIDLLYKAFSGHKVSISKVLKENLYKSISLKAIAQQCNMSESAFKKEFRKQYNSSPIQWIMDRKLEKAHLLLLSTEMSVSDIAYECGFENYVHFSRRFKSKYGKSANEIRALL